MGRPTKRTKAREARLTDALRTGNTRRASCSAAGFSEDTLARWLAEDADFAERVKAAEDEAERVSVGVIRDAAPDTWQAAAWWLERRRAQDWGKVDRVELIVRQQAERLAASEGLDPEELIAEAERIVSGAH